jgi:hypothetical protein
MKQIRMPDQDLTATGKEVARSQIVLAHHLLPIRFKEELRMGFRRHLGRGQPEATGTEVRKLMTGGVVEEGTTVGLNIREGNPDPTHETQGQ